MGTLQPHSSRQDNVYFDPLNFYTMFNSRYSTIDFRTDSDKEPGKLSSYNTTDAENWQFFFQDGFYYIRNFRWGPSMQLGLTTSNKEVPQMYPRVSDSGQQWRIREVEPRSESMRFKWFVMTNEMLGDAANFSVPANEFTPGMHNDIGAGELWNITINLR